MIKFSKVVSSIIDTVKRRRVKLQILGRDNVEEVYESMPFGEDNNPPENLRAVYVETSRRGKAVLLGYINTNQLETVSLGEKRIYSTNEAGNTLSAFIQLKNDGTAEFLGTGDFLVRYNELETAFNQLKDDHDALITRVNQIISEVGVFAGAYVPGGPAIQGTPPTFTFGTGTENPSTADITTAKITEAKTTPNQ